MRLSPLFRMTALFVFAGFLAAASYAQQDASQQTSDDPVAEAARKARAEQKTAPKPKKVFTNDDMPSTPATPPSAATTAAGGQTDVATAGGKDDLNNDPKSEAYWRKRFAKQREKISSTEQELDVLQRELNKDQVQYYNDPQKALMQQHDRADINDKTAKIDAKKKELEDLKQQLSDMEDDLRKAGGDPGWGR
jgi:DNA repair exonuclease SbcCD ATPase subunit